MMARLGIFAPRLAALWLAVLLGLGPMPPAAAWPDRPIRIMVGFQAGGSSDAVARLLAEKLRSELGGASIVVENRPGANGQIAFGVMLSANDNHTFLLMGEGAVIGPLLSSKVRHTVRDFRMISLVCEGTQLLLAPSAAPFKTFPEFVTYARVNPGKISYVSSGIGNPQHLVGEYLAAELKLDMVHVPSRGGGQAVTELVGGQMQLGILGLGPTLPHIRSGALTALAVTVDKRMPQLPGVPTLAEVGVTDFIVTQWFALAGPADLPDGIAGRMAAAVAKALDDPALRQRLEEIGFVARASTPEALTEKVRVEGIRWKKLIDERGLRID